MFDLMTLAAPASVPHPFVYAGLCEHQPYRTAWQSARNDQKWAPGFAPLSLAIMESREASVAKELGARLRKEVGGSRDAPAWEIDGPDDRALDVETLVRRFCADGLTILEEQAGSRFKPEILDRSVGSLVRKTVFCQFQGAYKLDNGELLTGCYIVPDFSAEFGETSPGEREALFGLTLALPDQVAGGEAPFWPLYRYLNRVRLFMISADEPLGASLKGVDAEEYLPGLAVALETCRHHEGRGKRPRVAA